MRNQISNQHLIDAIRLLKKDSSNEQLFLEALHNAKFLCPVQANTGALTKNTDSSVVLDDDTPISIVSIADSSGTIYFMAFTEWDELNKRNKGMYKQTVVYTFDDYRRLLSSSDMSCRGVVLNPFSDNIVLPKEIFADNNPYKKTGRGNETVMIGLPKDYPTKMVEKLKRHFGNIKLVEAAYLLWMVREHESGYLLVLGTKASPQQLFPQIGEICRPYLGDKPIDMIPMNTPFGKSAVEGQKPFYPA